MRFVLRHLLGELSPREAGGALLLIAALFIGATLGLGLSVQLAGVDMRASPGWATFATLAVMAVMALACAWFVIGAFASLARGIGGFGRDELLIGIALAAFAAAWSGRAAYLIAEGQPVLDALGLTAARGVWAVRADGDTLRVAGDIRPGLAERIAAEVAANPKLTTVAIDSPGGRLDAARRIAATVKEHDLDVEVRAMCASACLTVLVAGERRIAHPRALIGCHQPSDMLTGEPVGEFGGFPLIFPPADATGIYRDMVRACNLTPPEDILYLSHEDLARVGAITHVGAAPR